MRYLFFRIALLSLSSMVAISSQAQPAPLRINYAFDDSLKVTSFYCEVTIPKIATPGDRFITCGFSNGLFGFSYNGTKKVLFSFYGSDGVRDSSAAILKIEKILPFAIGNNVVTTSESQIGEASWNYPFLEDSTYRFVITAMPDSVQTFYTAYFFEPKKKKWKMLAAFNHSKDGKYLQGMYSLFNTYRLPYGQLKPGSIFSNPWIQTEDKQWHSLVPSNRPDTSLHPVVDLYKNLDSTTQAVKETKEIRAAIAKGILHKMNYKDGIYYEILKEGVGRNVLLSDTVVAFYKGSILNGETFDQTEKEPATFPLNRLIKGWQIGVPWCKVGGKIRLVLPSALAYSIRTRSSKIPPNSILVFDIEVLAVK